MNRTCPMALLVAALALAGCGERAAEAPAASGPQADAAPVAEGREAGIVAAAEAWRTERLERLQRPDGWLSLVGLHWIEAGRHTVGSGSDNAVVLATGPARLGEVELADGRLRFFAAEDSAATVDGRPVAGPVLLSADAEGRVPRLVFADGDASLQAIERSGRFALRVRDANAPTRVGFVGIEHYPVDPAWYFEARFDAHPPGQTIDIANVLGSIDPMDNPGALVFERDGVEHRLEAVDEGGEQLFIIFADRTNRSETYGAGRFVYVDRPLEGRTAIDFNRAYNPPCAFTAHSTCPLPPPENRLDLAVTAGERRYLGPTE
jgi:uncharacterized protein